MTGIVVVITNYYTSMHYKPVQKIARASETGHATNIIAGLALASTLPRCRSASSGSAILLSYNFAGLYGIAVAVMAMLSMAGIIISLDAFGPITDNAGGIAVMSNLPKEVRQVTDELDAVGNTMKAVTKRLRDCVGWFWQRWFCLAPMLKNSGPISRAAAKRMISNSR